MVFPTLKFDSHTPIDKFIFPLDENVKFVRIPDQNAIRLGMSPVRVGSQEARNDLIIKHRFVSRQHAVLYGERDGWYVVDRASTNKTIIMREGKTILLEPEIPVRLEDGDRLFFSQAVFANIVL